MHIKMQEKEKLNKLITPLKKIGLFCRVDGMNQLHQQEDISQCFANVGILKYSVDR